MSEPTAAELLAMFSEKPLPLPDDHSKCGPGPGSVMFEMTQWEMHFGRVLAHSILEEVRVFKRDPSRWNLTWEQQAKRVLGICEMHYRDYKTEQLRVSQLSPAEIRKTLHKGLGR